MKMQQRVALLPTLAIVLAWLVSAPALFAQAPTLSVEEPAFEIEAVLRQSPANLQGRLRLLADAAVDVTLLASDLRLEGAAAGDRERQLGREAIRLAGPTQLEANVPTDITIDVRQVARPGVWTGTLQLRAVPTGVEPSAGAEAVTVVELPIRLDLGEPPKVKSPHDQRVFRLVRCQNTLTCAVARLVLGDGMVRDEWSLVLDNQGRLEVEIEQAKALLLARGSGHRPTLGSLSLAAPETLPADRSTEVPLTLDRMAFDPDEYSGQFRFELAGADEPLEIGTQILVRQGPMPAILVLVFGIVVGRLARSLRSRGARLQLAAVPVLHRLEGAATKLSSSDVRTLVGREIETLRRQMMAGQVKIADWQQNARLLGEKIAFLVDLDALDRLVEQGAGEVARVQLVREIEEARVHVLAGRVEAAEAKVEDVRSRLADQAMGGGQERALEVTLKSLDERGAELRERASGTPQRVGPLRSLLAWLAGVETYQAELRYWLVRPLLWLTLLVALALLGLEALYVDEATFGARGVFDFLGLFVWGVTSDIARQGLLGLQRQAAGEGDRADRIP